MGLIAGYFNKINYFIRKNKMLMLDEAGMIDDTSVIARKLELGMELTSFREPEVGDNYSKTSTDKIANKLEGI